MGKFALGVQRVGVYNHHAGAQRAQANDQVLNQVRHLNGDAITLLQSGFMLQPSGEIRR